MSLLRRPAWWAVLLTLAGALLFLRLGVWQLDRANEKEQLLRRYATSATAPVREFAAAADAHGCASAASAGCAGAADASTTDAYPHVQARGEYLADRVYLLDNPKHDQRGGVEVYVPFRVKGLSRLLLVDLGFLPGNGTDQAPQLPPLPTGERELQGLYQPPPGVGFEMGGDALARQSNWPKTTVYLDVPQLSKDLGAPLYPHVLSLDADPAAIYVREHTPDFSSMPPARHRAYAFQWFTFAVVAVVMFFILHRRRKPKASDSP